MRRDGKGSHCEMLACADDLIVLQNFVFGDTPTPAAIRLLIDYLLRQGHEFDLSQYDLARTTDIRPLVLETVLTYLELDGVLTPLGPFYAGYQIQFVHGEARLLSGHKPERQQFLKALFNSGKRGYKWITINSIDEAAVQIGESRERIMKALHFLEEANDIVLKPSGLRHRFRLCDDAEKRNPAVICERMQILFAEREVKDAERLGQVTDFAEDRGCLTRHLLRYFGEDLDTDCGHCGSCLEASQLAKSAGKSIAKTIRVIPKSPEPKITVEDVSLIQALLKEKHAALRAPRQVARFLCGLTSPATSRDKLGKNDAFGMLEGYPFQTVLEQVDSMMTA